MRDLAHAVEHEGAPQAGVGNDEFVVRAHRQAVRAAGAEEAAQHAHLAERAVTLHRTAPHGVATRDGQEEGLAVRIQRQAVGAGRIGQQHVQAAVGGVVAVDASTGVVHARLALVGKPAAALRIEDQVVDALEGLAVAMAQHGFGLAALGRQAQQATAVVGNPDAAVAMDGQAIGPAVILGHHVPGALRIDAQDAAVRDVGHIEVARAVEDRAFQETVDGFARLVGIRPG
ncbi:hypothetical protein RAN3_0386 [plant metagenome]|uniref:Uncharacterized protein n=1 Tax=plant metagenome TaxID=1297885 RepID=A0A484V9M4_9ZZZZ